MCSSIMNIFPPEFPVQSESPAYTHYPPPSLTTALEGNKKNCD